MDALGHDLKDEDVVLIEGETSLKDLATRLRIPVASLFEDGKDDLDNGVKICRSTEGFTRIAERKGTKYYTYRHLATTDAAPELMALHVMIHCGDDNKVVLNGGHGSKEIVYILEGRVRMHWQHGSDLRQVDLEPGDSVYINPGVSHSFISADGVGGKCSLLAVNY